MEVSEWKLIFGKVLKVAFLNYGLRDNEFAELYKCDPSNTKKWKRGRSFPRDYLFDSLKEYITEKASNANVDEQIFLEEIKTVLVESNMEFIYFKFHAQYKRHDKFVIQILSYCRNKGKLPCHSKKQQHNMAEQMNVTKAVVFDFDGTLTLSGKIAKTTWEKLWVSLGYDVKLCHDLHKEFDDNKITHAEWCKKTEDKFIERDLHEKVLHEIAKEIELIPGVKETFEELNRRYVKIYIVSGSILHIIRKVLGDKMQYVESVMANDFMFDKNGYLTKIIGTDYDFEGKAAFVCYLANILEISTSNVLFVGNSRNDQYVHESGARTLCINPRLTDITNRKVWNYYIEKCNNLTEILDYVE